MGDLNEQEQENLKMIIIPLKRCCKTTSEVVDLIQKVFDKIMQEKDLSEFKIEKEKKKGIKGALANSIILEPSIGGMGFSFNKLYKYMTED
jgi:hypothetical protein